MQTNLFFDSAQLRQRSETFTTYFTPTLELKQGSNHQISLISASFWYSWHNIKTNNNKIKYHNKTTWKTITIPPGAYNIVDIDNAVKRQMKAKGDYNNTDKTLSKYYINIEVNYNILIRRLKYQTIME